jgi:hypothetical protein
LLSLVAFGYMLYALQTAYQMTDIFLDRSYWGKGEHEKFGKLTREQIEKIRNDVSINLSSRQQAANLAVNEGMTAEIESFLGLTNGMKVAFEWHKNWFKEEAVAFTIECADWPIWRELAVKIELLSSSNSVGVVVLNERKQVLLPSRDPEKKGIYELEKAWVFSGDSHENYTKARVSFDVVDKNDEGINLVVRDTLLARRNA